MIARRVLIGVACFLVGITISYIGAWRSPPPPLSNGSTDGRVHTCGYVTDAGVTDHLDAYEARCGRLPDTRCEEDMPCWDCTTMGNHICGPTIDTKGAP